MLQVEKVHLPNTPVEIHGHRVNQLRIPSGVWFFCIPQDVLPNYLIDQLCARHGVATKGKAMKAKREVLFKVPELFNSGWKIADTLLVFCKFPKAYVWTKVDASMTRRKLTMHSGVVLLLQSITEIVPDGGCKFTLEASQELTMLCKPDPYSNGYETWKLVLGDFDYIEVFTPKSVEELLREL